MMLFSTSLAGPALDWAQHEPLLQSKCAKEHLCNFEQLCHDYGLGDNPKKIQLFQLSLAGQAKEWAKFNAQHAFKTWNGYKGAFLYRFAKGPIYVPPPRPSYSQHHPSSPDINKTPLSQGRAIKLRAKPRLKICFKILFKQVIKLDEDIKKLREDHDRSLNLVKLDVASKYQELLNKSMRIEDTSYGNSKHLGSIYNRLQALEGSSHANYKRERSPTPNHPPFYCNAITRRSTTQVHEDNEEEEREYEEQLNDEDEEQSIDINASPKQSMDTPSPKTLVSHQHQEVKLLHFQDLEAMQRPSPSTEEEDTWQYDPIDPNKISPMKLKEFNAKVKSLPFYVTFEEAWDKHGLVEFFFTTSENKEEIHQLFRKARFPIAPHAVNQPPSPPSSPPPKWYVNSISREKLAEFNQFVQTLPASMSSNKLGATTHSPPSSTTARDT
ncbi:unnamed protein product [Microthlaspi erraticum]|uniref:Retrotransposon gag domain-containing protein n=1 Tax=Microthlaspi erraticum TaxID=1685480 RepID=A0A6D2HR68_9BRAS|nr:unnamed protein product [Microthlaspi erraticum]